GDRDRPAPAAVGTVETLEVVRDDAVALVVEAEMRTHLAGPSDLLRGLAGQIGRRHARRVGSGASDSGTTHTPFSPTSRAARTVTGPLGGDLMEEIGVRVRPGRPGAPWPVAPGQPSRSSATARSTTAAFLASAASGCLPFW